MTSFVCIRAENQPDCAGVAETPDVCTGVTEILSVFTGVIETPPDCDIVAGTLPLV